MALSRAETEQALIGKFGFALHNRRGQDHRVYRLIIDGQPVARTHVSTGTGKRTLGDDLVASMARQLHVTPAFFRQMVGCTKD